MRPLVPVAALLVALAGCLAAPQAEPAEEQPPGAVAPASADLGEPYVLTWTGQVLAGGPLGGFSHMRPYEDVVWPVQQVGFLLDLPEVPQAVEVELAWEGGGQWLIMLHSHKADGTNTYVEHITEFSDQQPQCLRVPTEDLTAGHWQVMVHTDDEPRNAGFTLTVRTWGVEGSVVEDERHGHWLHDGAFDVDEHDILPCQGADETHH